MGLVGETDGFYLVSADVNGFFAVGKHGHKHVLSTEPRQPEPADDHWFKGRPVSHQNQPLFEASSTYISTDFIIDCIENYR